MVQAVGETNRIFAERDFRPKIDGAVIAAIDGNGRIAERFLRFRGVLGLLAFVVIVFVVTIVRLGGNVALPHPH